MAKYLPKRLRSLYRSGWAVAINGFTSSDSAIDEIEGQCHERDDFCHRFTAASTNRKLKSSRPDNLAVQTINLKVGKPLGIDIPATLLAAADE
jgi:hypothetical protein